MMILQLCVVQCFTLDDDINDEDDLDNEDDDDDDAGVYVESVPGQSDQQSAQSG